MVCRQRSSSIPLVCSRCTPDAPSQFACRFSTKRKACETDRDHTPRFVPWRERRRASLEVSQLFAFLCPQTLPWFCADGAKPISLIQASDRNFYGVTETSCASHSNTVHPSGGTIFKITASGQLTVPLATHRWSLQKRPMAAFLRVRSGEESISGRGGSPVIDQQPSPARLTRNPGKLRAGYPQLVEMSRCSKMSKCPV